MGLSARYTATCDGCGLKAEKHLVLGPDTVDTGYFTIWGPAIPTGWFERRGKVPTFYHSGECYTAWLRSQGKVAEATEFENAVWVA